jgi:hypothetical protein
VDLVYISGLKPVGCKDTQGPRRSIIRELELYIPISFRQNYGSRAHRAIEPLSLINMPSPTWGSCVIWENRIIAGAMRRVIRGQAKTLNIVAFRKHLG